VTSSSTAALLHSLPLGDWWAASTAVPIQSPTTCDGLVADQARNLHPGAGHGSEHDIQGQYKGCCARGRQRKPPIILGGQRPADGPYCSLQVICWGTEVRAAGKGRVFSCAAVSYVAAHNILTWRASTSPLNVTLSI
jgi:hypothetical protein